MVKKPNTDLSTFDDKRGYNNRNENVHVVLVNMEKKFILTGRRTTSVLVNDITVHLPEKHTSNKIDVPLYR